MAGQESTVSMDDKELFSQAMTDAPAEETPVAETRSDETPRDELGRFAAKEEAEAKPAEAKPAEAKTEVQQTQKPTEAEDDKSGQVPSWRLREEREAREAAQQRAEEATRNTYSLQNQMQALQRKLSQLETPKQEPIDVFADPEKAFDQRLAPVRTDLESFKSEIRLDMSRELAVIKHGEPAVQEMETAIEKAMAQNHPDMPFLAAQMRSSKNPTAKAMEWYHRSRLVEKTGGNLETYRQSVLDEAMKDPAFQAKVIEAARGQTQPANGSRPNIQMPPSLNRIPGSGTSTAAQDSDDVSDRALFEHATRR